MAAGNGQERASTGREDLRVRYMDHVVTLLRLLRTEETLHAQPSPLPPETYIGNGSSSEFWELIGFRIWGHPHLLLAAVRFPRQAGAMVEYGRESLPYFLMYPNEARTTRPGSHSTLEVILPGPDESVPLFLEALRDGEERPIVRVDPNRVQFAFDFRTVNPSSLSRIRPEPMHPRTTAIRTTEGHILVGATKNLPDKLEASTDFLMLLNPIQRTPRGTHVLPTLVLHKAFVAAAAEVPADSDERSLERLHPFSSGTALPSPLLT